MDSAGTRRPGPVACMTFATEAHSIPPTVSAHIKQIIESEHYPVEVIPFYAGIVLWTRIHGLVMLELFDHTPPAIGDPETFYRFEVDTLLADLGLAL